MSGNDGVAGDDRSRTSRTGRTGWTDKLTSPAHPVETLEGLHVEKPQSRKAAWGLRDHQEGIRDEMSEPVAQIMMAKLLASSRANATKSSCSSGPCDYTWDFLQRSP